jgi:hypothetical protein
MFALWHKFVGLTVPAFIPLALTILSLYFALKAYRRKAGAHVRGVCTTRHSRSCNDKFVSEVILENLKDRAVTIFGIYLRIGYAYYLELEDLQESPLILKPYETYRKAFGPIEFYAVSDKRIDLNDLLGDRKIKKHLFLSTSDGKYRVKSPLRRWNPMYDWFSNYSTAAIKPIRSIHRDQSFGGNIKFVVDFEGENGSVETIPIHPRDYELKLFKDFQLTSESLATQESLEKYLLEKKEEGQLFCKRIVVYDLQSWRVNAHEFYRGETLKAEHCGWFNYYVVGKLYTRYQNRKAKRNNLRNLRSRKEKEAATIELKPNLSTDAISNNAPESATPTKIP